MMYIYETSKKRESSEGEYRGRVSREITEQIIPSLLCLRYRRGSSGRHREICMSVHDIRGLLVSQSGWRVCETKKEKLIEYVFRIVITTLLNYNT